LGGLWEFPTFAISPAQRQRDSLHKELKEKIGIPIEIETPLSPVHHTYSHFKATYYPFICRPIKGKQRLDDLTWAPPQKIRDYPLSSVYQKILKQSTYSFSSSDQLSLFKVAEQTNI
jgi:adenine-specific DNA glycosylase